MSNIYDIANIEAGDPQGQVGMAVGQVLADIEKKKEDERIIKELNQAYQYAEDMSKKGKKGYGLASSILGGLLTAGFGPLGAALGSGLVSWGGEQMRQKAYDPTEKLEEFKEKYEGQDIAEGIDEDIEAIDEHLDSAAATDFAISTLASWGLGGLDFEKAKAAVGGDPVTEELIGESIETVAQEIPMAADEIAMRANDPNKMLDISPFEASKQDNILDMVKNVEAGELSPAEIQNQIHAKAGTGKQFADVEVSTPYSYGQTGQTPYTPATKASITPNFNIDEGLFSGLTGIPEDMISKLTSKMKLDTPLGQSMLGLLRFGGTPLLQDLMMNEYRGKRMASAPFKNPFRRF